jgi:hypothetical protein
MLMSITPMFDLNWEFFFIFRAKVLGKILHICVAYMKQLPNSNYIIIIETEDTVEFK